VSEARPITTAPLRPMRGPSALGGDTKRFWTLAWTLAALEFRLKFFGSVLGYFWQLMRPLLLFSVLYVVFTEFVKIGDGVEHYPAVLLMGIVMHTFFSESTQSSVTSVLARENLVRKIHFPRLVIPAAVVITAGLNFLLNFAAVIVFFVIQGVEVRPSWVELIPLMAFLAALSTGIAMALSALYVRYRDVGPIWDVVIPISFYGTPILYPLETIPSRTAQELLMLNPLAVVVQQARHALIDPGAMSAAEAIGGAPRLLIPLGIVVAVCAIGYTIFSRSAPHIAEEL
jgi:ABC-2 type transport system permease protein